MSKKLIDTNSLLFLVRDLLPLDKSQELYKFIENEFTKGNFILLKAVYDEATSVRGGLILEKLKYLDESKKDNEIKEIKKHKKIKKEKNLEVLYYKEHHIIDENWAIKGRLDQSSKSYSELKENFIKQADCQLVFYSLRNNKIPIITEESVHPNDEKLFKKIPSICKSLNIPCFRLTNYLKENNFTIQKNLITHPPA